MLESKIILDRYWGYTGFLPKQEEIIRNILKKKDTLALLPTGGGKSICYQVPSLILDGICIVISPLIALMKDQVEDLKNRNIKATCIESSMNVDEILTCLTNCLFGNYKFLYLSPEKLENELVKNKISEMNVNLIAVDEAHCISEWGHNFRSSYRNISEIRKIQPHSPILALTATATKDVIEDIYKNLKFNDNNLIKSSFERKNISYIVRKENNKENKLLEILNKISEPVIIYVRRRKDCETIQYILEENKFRSTCYHAGIDHKERYKNQKKWSQEECQIMIATNAFGMGINKPNVRAVIHLYIPYNIESYFQESGRAGRDNKASYSVLIYNQKDINYLTEHVDIQFPSVNNIKLLYQNLANFLQVPVNTGENEDFSFNLKKFIKRYGIDYNTANSILRELEKENYIRLTKRRYNRSQIIFLLNKKNLSEFQNSNKKYRNIITRILRTYPGVFEQLTQIDEKNISLKEDISLNSAINSLTQLQDLGILKYEKNPEEYQITYIQNRIDEKFLKISENSIEKRKERYINKSDSMINYVQKKICRNKMILSYFGEKAKIECNKCDVCKG